MLAKRHSIDENGASVDTTELWITQVWRDCSRGDSGVEAGVRLEEVGVGGGDEVVADDAIDVPEVAHSGVGIVGIGAIARARATEADAARAIDDDVLLDQCVAARVPEVDRVLGETGWTPEAGDPVAPHDPAPGGVRVDAAGVAVVAHERPSGVGELDGAAFDRAVVGPALPHQVDLDRLLPGVDDTEIVQQGAGDQGGIARDMDGMVVRLAQREVGNDHVRGGDRDQLTGQIVAVQDDGVAISLLSERR